MSNLIVLEGIELIPVLELEPFTFATKTRESPSRNSSDISEEEHRYWTDSLADSGITGLRPLRHGSWHVPTVNFDVFNLQRYLEKKFEEYGGIETFSDPDCKLALNGGLALQCVAQDLLIKPRCCADLSDAHNWKEAAEYRGDKWKMLWIGHPCLSFRYEAPSLVLSEQHESDTPSECWVVCPDELNRAVDAAMAELDRFAGELARVLPLLGYREDSSLVGRKLAGLGE